MRIGIFSLRAFDRRLARLAAPISSRVRQGGGAEYAPPAGRVRLNTPAGRGLNINENCKALFYHSLTELKWNILTLKAGLLPWLHEGNVIVEDQLTHNFKRRSRKAPPKAVFYAQCKMWAKLEMILFLDAPDTDEQVYGNLIGWGYR